jgi:homoserine dehydrogenase
LNLHARSFPFSEVIAVYILRYNRTLKLAIIGYGNVGRALARLLREKHLEFPFTITGIHTPRHGTAVDASGLPAKVTEAAEFGPRAASVDAFLDAARAQVAVELTTLNPSTGEPAAGHIAAMARRMHVVTANKGPIAHAPCQLRDEAALAGVGLRFEPARRTERRCNVD